MVKRSKPYGLDPKEEIGWEKEEKEREKEEDRKAWKARMYD